MNEKYKTLNELENIITPYILRIIKENDKPKLPQHVKYDIATQIQLYINKFAIIGDNKNKLISDVINLICETGDISIQNFIDDLNHSRNCERKIKNLEGLIYHISRKLSNMNLVTQPLLHLMCWSYTIRGDKFYRKLNEQLNNKLRIMKLINHYING